MTKTRIILVDDHKVLRAGLRMLINSQEDMEVVAETDDCREVLPQIEAFRPDVLILDLSLPSGSSLPLISQASSLEYGPHILILTMHDDLAYVRAALGAGAKGYVVKSISERDLLEAIRFVERGQRVIDLDNEALTTTAFDSLLGVPSKTGLPARGKLSDREAEVLRLLGQGVSNLEIAKTLDLSPKTVSTYRARIGEKLGLRTMADFVRYTSDLGTG